jgi:uncharacterized protein involved in response to NO
MKRTAETQRAWKGAALWSRGFRPFFLVAALWAASAVAVWPPFFTGEIRLPTAFSPIDWHAHEMIYGYGVAVVVGFLLTAIPNWTGRLPVAGWPLAGFVGLWGAGRLAVFFSSAIGPVAAAFIDTAFLVVFAGVSAREIVAGKNWRNLKVVAILLLLAGTNLGFHIEASMEGSAPVAARAGIALIVFLILLIGGRIVPSFTHNWLARHGIASRPIPFGPSDRAIMIVSGLALLAWIGLPDHRGTGLALVASGVANLWRLSRWRGGATLSDRLVLILHGGFLLASTGFLIAAVHAFRPDLISAPTATHVWAVGAIGSMTLAMMTRVTLGHTGRDFIASRATQAIYSAVLISLLARVAMEFAPGIMVPMMYMAAAAWILAFAGFVAAYAPTLVTPAGR